MSDLFADLFAACSIFFIRASMSCELSELSGYSLFFEFVPTSPVAKSQAFG